MPICLCGCDGEPKGGDFCPGHDQKLRTEIEKSIGGLGNLKKLAEVTHDYVNEKISLDSFGQRVRSIIPQR